jgi:mono/diheme cytochrome c family protein
MPFQFTPRSGKTSDRSRPSASPRRTAAKSIEPSTQWRHRSRRRPIGLFLLLLLWSIVLGLGLAQAALPRLPESVSSAVTQRPATAIAQALDPDPDGLVDRVPPDLQLGQALYLENCATCHVALPPAVMPTESWREILTQPAHYGAEITPPVQPGLQIIWNYVSVYSRPLQQGESVPFRLRSSRYFKALHPKVEFADRVNVRSCAGCHPGAEQFNYRSLTPEWQAAP